MKEPGRALAAGQTAPLVLIWHHHQPLYRDLTRSEARGSYRRPWVRLHALRDYYGMGALLDPHPGVRLTFNFSPALLWQIEDYARNGASDELLELTITPAESLDEEQRARLVAAAFNAEWRHQIAPHARYRELFAARQEGRRLDVQDLRDLQVWSSLAWFAREFRDADVLLATGETLRVARFVEQARGFSHADVRALVVEQYKLMRAIVPLHRRLQNEGRIELAASPYYHPILPLLMDSDLASLDRPGARLPPRFHHPEDARAQVRLALEASERWWGRRPAGMWPAEGAVSQAMIPLLHEAGVGWIAADQGVLAKSGRWGYRSSDVAVRSRIYRAEESGRSVATFFRDRELADDIGFHCSRAPDSAGAAVRWVRKLVDRIGALPKGDQHAVTVVLDGENAWGWYPDDGRPFLHALYHELANRGVRTATPSDCLAALSSPPERVHDLYTGSWVDERGSDAGVDLGTWIGEPQENRAWELLGDARQRLVSSGATPEQAPRAFQALYAAEGSDWFWWYGDDQGSGHDAGFDELFRAHLTAVYTGIGVAPPAALRAPIAPGDAPAPAAERAAAR